MTSKLIRIKIYDLRIKDKHQVTKHHMRNLTSQLKTTMKKIKSRLKPISLKFKRFITHYSLLITSLPANGGQARLPQPARSDGGQAALIIVFGLGLMGVFVAIAFSGLGPQTIIRDKTLSESSKAYYAAQSGIEELMIRLRSHHDFGDTWSMQDSLENGAYFYATISGDESTKIATATGIFDQFTRRLEVKVASDAAKTSFLFAVQVGDGGLLLERNTVVRGANNTPGNVYSNGVILGNNPSSGGSGSRILGEIWAVDKISGLNGDTTGGVYVTGDAHANELVRCAIVGNVTAPAPPGAGCPYNGTYSIDTAPATLPIQGIDIEFWKQQAVGASTWSGDCNISSSGGPTDCSGVEKELGPVKIEGNLVVNSNTTFTLSGPVWVEGDITLNSNVDIYIDDSLGSEGVVVVADYPSDQFSRGKIVAASNVDFFQTSLGGPPVFVSTNSDDNCTVNPAIIGSSNTASVVYSAPNGCIFFQSNSFVKGVLADKVYLSNNSIIEYDPRLAAVILKTGLGGWAVTDYQELE